MGRSTSCSRYSVWPPWQGSDSALTFGKIASATYKVNSTGRPCSPRRRTGGSRRHVTGRPTGCIPCSKPRGASILVGCALCAVQRGEGFRPSDGGNRVVTTTFRGATGPDSGCPGWSCVKAEARLCGLSDLELTGQQLPPELCWEGMRCSLPRAAANPCECILYQGKVMTLRELCLQLFQP
jgi:hypothetical protein